MIVFAVVEYTYNIAQYAAHAVCSLRPVSELGPVDQVAV